MVLVTGSTGLVGSHLLYNLVKENEKVKALVRNRNKIKLVEKVFSYYSDDYKTLINKIDWVNGDVLEQDSLAEAFVDVRKVYHCAAIVSIGGRKPGQLINANVQGTENVVNLCLQHEIQKLSHISSIAALGNSVNGEAITEKTKWSSSKNQSAYSVSKFKSEMEVWRGIQEGLKAVIVNPSVIIGPGFWETGSGELFTKAAKGMRYYTTGSTGFVDVRDVADSMIKLMESEINSERFVINSENVIYKDLFNNIANAVGVKPPWKEATEKLLKTAVFLDSVASKLGIKRKEITKDVAKASLSKSHYSNDKIKEAIGKTFIPIEKSIADTADKFKKELTVN